ncbi:M56 family metallopeptidase [uncultured Phenylobacterium sp.]|uniref:M56 family metallopeptidase n=1 Tax=uncultured Phenylobacterium sp. TaxID=349273 RepID=UPI0025F3883E|nr:M56 family metallopeptidase [uncultured Phenylobacterium sp.]
MTSLILADLIRANLAGAAAILVVLLVRVAARRFVGPEMAYYLWAAPPLAALATLMPAPTVDGFPPADALAHAVRDWSAPALVIWALGLAVTLAAFGWAQHRFLAAARAGKAGPSVVGVIAPRIYMPPDDGRYTAEERAVIRAHEHEHVVRSDPRAGALAAALQVLCWFNPFVHIGAHAMRLDQELACDAAVLRRRPHDRCLYAKTLLKTQLDAQMLPFGCRWPAKGLHPLEVRVGLLRSPVRYDGLAGPILIAMGLTIITLCAWSVQPPDPRHPQPVIDLWRNQPYRQVSVMLVAHPALEVPN